MSSKDFLLACAIAALIAGIGSLLIVPLIPAPRAPARTREAASVVEIAHRVDEVTGTATGERADALLVARRISLGLSGTIPSLADIRMLEGTPEEARVELWLSRTLEDPRSHAYLAERYARTLVGTKAGPFVLYRRHRFVDWLEGEFAADTPYDVLARKVIAAKGLWTDAPATNFVTSTIVVGERDGRPNEAELAGRVSRAFLARRIDCAECHDHPFDKWTQKDFQGLAAFFTETRSTFAGVRERPGQDVETPRVPFLPELLPETGARRERLATWLTHENNRAFARAATNRAWALLFGRPLVTPIDDIREGQPLPPALDVLAEDFAAHGYDLRRLFRVIVSTKTFQSASFPASRLRPEQLAGSILQAASIETVSENHALERFAANGKSRVFVERYGDAGDDEMAVSETATVTQRLVLMNGELVSDVTMDHLFRNSATQIAVMARNDDEALRALWLCFLTRRPSPSERDHFAPKLAAHPSGVARREAIEDIAWILINTTELSWNH